MSAINGVNSYMPTNTISTSQTSEDKDMFMKLLVEQLRNQDPLSPMSSQEFLAQMAQFTSVEKLTSINESLIESTNMDLILTQSISNTMASNLIGKSITAFGDSVAYDGETAVDLQFRLDGTADRVTMTIKDENGKVVRVIDQEEMLAEGDHSLSWDGKDADGVIVDAGIYNYEITATTGDGNTVSSFTLMNGLVQSIKYDGGAAILMVNGTEVVFSDVLEIGLGDS